MPELIAKTALAGKKLVVAGTTLAEIDHGAVRSIAPYPGQELAVGQALLPLGFGFPAVNSFAEKDGALIAWAGREQAFLIGADCPDLGGLAAVTDQSGGWVSLSLQGPLAVEALARYVPMDMRLAAFPVGAAARTPLYHMSMVLMRVAEDGFRLMLFRSMARTAWHEIEVALKTLAARAA
ncbi:sarcosine oxidase subunit gamma [Cypionkella aquatica]|uniref:Sarcosine oxidase subunit gamma n=1 Tax=Cypionkella aquatica TaxID=1756042 RepID=A0AA37U493_9RHOB|nr:sarcosine oxidase subunit gamma family protein [Cypionkella aquatica]GLS86980.1 sarcosine oxidase subunit gamma [Cypionkella aquatica]